MVFDVRRSRDCRRDLDTVFDFLISSYEAVGETPGESLARAGARLAEIEDSIDSLGRAPHQRTLWPEIMQDLRWTTKNRAIIYFVVDDRMRRVDVLAVLFGGQDHKEPMLRRILSGGM